jgi:anti-anti-sigma factor
LYRRASARAAPAADGMTDALASANMMTMHDLHLSIEPVENTLVFRLDGPVETHGYDVLLRQLLPLLNDAAPRIILDFARVNYVGSAQLKEIMDLAHHARARGGDIKCTGLAPTIQQLANLIAGGDPIECYADLPTALAAFHQQPATTTH